MIERLVLCELIKLRRTRITWLSLLAFSIFPAVGALFMWIVRDPARASSLGLIGQKAQLSGLAADCSGYFKLLLQATGLGGMIMVSVITAYVFGREYAQDTTKILLTLPVSRHGVVVAKLLVVFAWFAALSACMFMEAMAVVRLMALPGSSAALVQAALRDIGLVALVAWLLAPVVAWFALIGKGYFAPLGFTFVTLVLGNVIGATGWGKWFPWSIVPLFAGVAGPRTDTLADGSLVILALTFVVGCGASIWQLRCADNT